MAESQTMTRPMPRTERRALVEQYTGRRQALAASAHAYILYYENAEGYDIDWSNHTRALIERTVQKYPDLIFPTAPRCLCEEDFLCEILWLFVSNSPPAADEKEP